jgi:hypothetical protein
MATKKYQAKIKLPNGSVQNVTVEADTNINAKAMLEAQYGKGSVIVSPSEVH